MLTVARGCCAGPTGTAGSARSRAVACRAPASGCGSEGRPFQTHHLRRRHRRPPAASSAQPQPPEQQPSAMPNLPPWDLQDRENIKIVIRNKFQQQSASSSAQNKPQRWEFRWEFISTKSAALRHTWQCLPCASLRCRSDQSAKQHI